MILLYNLGLLLAGLLVGLPALVWVLLSVRRRVGFSQRLLPLPASRANSIWIHAASVGEAEAATPLVEALIERQVALVATTTTATGRSRLKTRFPGLSVRLAPLDLPGLVQLSCRRARLRLLILVETELWPNTISAALSAGADVGIVSGRLSDASFPHYLRARRFFAPLLRQVSWIDARSEEDRQRFVDLGARPERTRVGGDLKLDRAPAGPAPPELLESLGRGPFLVAGSTHPGEEEALLAAWQALRSAPGVAPRLILVPRHPERATQVRTTARRYGAEVGMRSEGADSSEVIVVDSVGELRALYGLADLVFCGGTLVPVGGHNLLEPVQAGKIVIHGPHTQNQRSLEALLAPLGVLRPVAGSRELGEVIRALWADPARNRPAVEAREILEAHRGALARALERVRLTGMLDA